MPPFGGQGVSSGLRDAHNLAWKLQLALQGLTSTALLDTYTIERRAHTAQIIRFSRFLGSIVMTTSRPLALVRDGILLTLLAVPAIREYLGEMRVKPQPRYKRGFFLPGDSHAGRKLAGMMLPQPEITTARGGKTLLDTALGPAFALLRLHENDDPRQAFASLRGPARESLQRLGTRFVAIQQGMDELHGFPLRDPGLFVLVRPDRYVYGACKEEQLDEFVAALQMRLHRPWGQP